MSPSWRQRAPGGACCAQSTEDKCLAGLAVVRADVRGPSCSKGPLTAEHGRTAQRRDAPGAPGSPPAQRASTHLGLKQLLPPLLYAVARLVQSVGGGQQPLTLPR